eukprot:1075226-Heterocapsa_arctica.AAC.1
MVIETPEPRFLMAAKVSVISRWGVMRLRRMAQHQHTRVRPLRWALRLANRQTKGLDNPTLPQNSPWNHDNPPSRASQLRQLIARTLSVRHAYYLENLDE